VAIKPNDSGTVSRAIAVLRATAEANGEIHIKGLSNLLSLPPSTVHRLLELLARTGMIERDEATRSYGVGREFFRLSALVTGKYSIISIAKPLLKEVVKKCNETAYLGVYLPSENKMMFAECCESSHSLGYRVKKNEPLSLVTGGSGLSILAYLTKEDIDRAYKNSRDDYLARKAVPNRKILESELNLVRNQGYALTFGKRISGAVGIFFPVFDMRGKVIGCLGCTIPEQRFKKNLLPSLIETISQVSGDLSMALGYQKNILT
jgi:DNA-binding IclR family transcriptional regulator